MMAGSAAASATAVETAAARTGARPWRAAPPRAGNRPSSVGCSAGCSAGPSIFSTCSALMTACAHYIIHPNPCCVFIACLLHRQLLGAHII